LLRRKRFRYQSGSSRGDDAAMVAPHFSACLVAAIGFWSSARCCLGDAIVSDFPPKSGLWCEAQVHAVRLPLRVCAASGLTRRETMQKGTVKWFNPTKGYGFIKPTTGEKDVFVHVSAVERAGLRSLNEGQEVEFELVTNRGRTSAENLKVA
jgi:CspA family cold shock protein